MKAALVCLMVVSMTASAFGSVTYDLTIGDTYQAKIDTVLVDPVVGGVTMSLDGTTYGDSSADVSVGPDAVWIGYYIFDVQGVQENYQTFCMDLVADASTSYTTHTVGAALTALEWMWGTYYDSIGTDVIKAAAFQLAVWEVVHENAQNPYDISSGSLFLADLDVTSVNNNGATLTGLVTQANAYLNSANWTTKASLVKLDDGVNQPFAMAVPEPMTLGLLAIGGLLIRRRK